MTQNHDQVFDLVVKRAADVTMRKMGGFDLPLAFIGRPATILWCWAPDIVTLVSPEAVTLFRRAKQAGRQMCIGRESEWVLGNDPLHAVPLIGS